MNIKDLPDSIPFYLDQDSGVEYPKNGDFETTHELELVCFNKKIYSQTWALRSRLMQVFTGLTGALGDLAQQAEPKEEKDESPMDGEDLMNACLIGGFDAPSALEEFKQIIVANDLIKLDENTALNKQRWGMMDSYVQEEIMFEYLANFIQPCVLTGKQKS